MRRRVDGGRRHSGGSTERIAEALANNAVAFIISILANFAVLPLFGFNVKFGQSVCITIIFTAISIVRTYLVRRVFAWVERRSYS